MIKVASYCRVSTDKDDQANSFEAQQRYFREYIDRQPDWELYATYADEGITGTSTKKRVQFNRMINDAHLGKFQLIITKEVSRFSRNILDTISFTRELRALGVGVLFMNDGISTLEPDAELRLSIMGSIAQEESRKTSSRVKWGQTRQMERGVVFGRSLLGYDVRNGKMTINPEGAEIVKMIFHKYGVEKKGTSIIARELQEGGYKTHRGSTKWFGSHIVKILKNEKYVGDLVQKKTITPDYLSHEVKTNHGEEELVIIKNHHDPIIDRELWDVVQTEMHKRDFHGEFGAGHSNRYLFSGKIKCGECGASFVARRKYRVNDTFYRRWSCCTATNAGRKRMNALGNEMGCNVGKIIRDDLALDMLKQSILSLRIDKDWIAENVTALAVEAITAGEKGSTDNAGKLEFEISQLSKKKEGVLNAFFARDISKEDMRLMNERYDRQLADLKERLQTARSKEELDYDIKSLEYDVRHQVSQIVSCQTDSEIFYKNLLDKIIIYHDNRAEVRLNLLPQRWIFILEKLDKLSDKIHAKSPMVHCDTDVSAKPALHKSEDSQGFSAPPGEREFLVPISVSRPFRSSNGIL